MDPNSTKYRISLDALDMNFLPVTYSRNYYNLTPLWSYSLDRNEYFEFEIREKTDKSENHEATETIHCHICNIEVPKIFINDHYKSKKHFINKRIADTALERIRKHLEDIKETDCINNNNNVYFCTECVAVVQINDRKSHEKQQSHRYSVMIDKLLSEFHLIYANDNDDRKPDIVYDNEDTLDVSELSEVERSDNDFSKVSDLDRSKADTNTVNNDKKDHVHDESILDTDESPKKVLKAHENVDKDTKDEFMKSNRFSILVDTPDKITGSNTGSSTPNTPTPNISEESNEQIDSSSSVNADSEEKYLHVIGEVINCKICFTRFDINSYKSHVNGTRHKMNKISDVHYMMKESGEELYCIVCLKSLPNTVESAKDHCSSANHISSYNKKISENGISLEANKLYCEICDKNIPKRNEFVHIFDKSHRKQKTQMIENFYCSVCEKYIPNIDVNIHDNSAEHIMKIKSKKKDFINSDDKNLIVTKEKIIETDILNNRTPDEIKKPPYFCTICEVNVPNGTNNIEIHNNGASHKKKEQKRADEILKDKQKYTKTSTQQPSSLSQQNTTTLKPSTSTQQPTGSSQQLTTTQKPSNSTQQHSGSSQQLTTTQKPSTSSQQLTTTLKPSTSAQQPSGSSQQLTNTQKPSTSTQQTPTHTAIKTQIMCKVCNVKVPNNKNNIKEHGNGRVHQNNYKQTLANEEIVQKDNTYHCILCSLDIDNPLNHITEPTHNFNKRITNLVKQIEYHVVNSLGNV